MQSYIVGLERLPTEGRGGEGLTIRTFSYFLCPRCRPFSLPTVALLCTGRDSMIDPLNLVKCKHHTDDCAHVRKRVHCLCWCTTQLLPWDS